MANMSRGAVVGRNGFERVGLGGYGLPRGNRTGQIRLLGVGAVSSLSELGIREHAKTGRDIPISQEDFLKRFNGLTEGKLWIYGLEHTGDMANRYAPVVQLDGTARPLILPDSWFIGVHSNDVPIGGLYSRGWVRPRAGGEPDFAPIVV